MFKLFMPAWGAVVFNAESGVGGGNSDGNGGGAGASASWFDDQRIGDDQRSYLTAKGLTSVSDPVEAISKMVGIGQAADRRFGKPLDAVMDRPAKDQSMADWRRANADVFGLPADAAGYQISRPEGLAEGIAWNDDLAGRMQKLAFDRGLAPDDVNAMTGMYAEYVAGVDDKISADMAAAEARLKADLAKMWGKDAEANTAKARNAASALAEAAGMDQDGIQAVVGLLSKGEAGETLALRMFAALGDMMSEDRAIGIKSGIGELGMSKSEAEAALKSFTAPGGEWAKAAAAGDTEAIARLRPQFDRLARQLAGAK